MPLESFCVYGRWGKRTSGSGVVAIASAVAVLSGPLHPAAAIASGVDGARVQTAMLVGPSLDAGPDSNCVVTFDGGVACGRRLYRLTGMASLASSILQPPGSMRTATRTDAAGSAEQGSRPVAKAQPRKAHRHRRPTLREPP